MIRVAWRPLNKWKRVRLRKEIVEGTIVTISWDISGPQSSIDVVQINGASDYLPATDQI